MVWAVGFSSPALNLGHVLEKQCAGLQPLGDHRLLLEGCQKVAVKSRPVVSCWEANNSLRAFQGEWVGNFPFFFSHCGAVSSAHLGFLLPQKLQSALNISQKKTLGADANTRFPLRLPFLLLNELHE